MLSASDASARIPKLMTVKYFISFPSIYEIRDATAEQIAMQADLPMSVAEEIYEFFHNHQEEDCRGIMICDKIKQSMA